MDIHVIKGNGEKAIFDPGKLKEALRSSGAGSDEQDAVVQQVTEKLYDGIPTRQIYKMAFDLLKKQSHELAGRYRLKNAIMELGPTGFPFEKFVGKVLETMGYEVETGVLIKGRCVQHEVDVVGRKNGEMLMIECKFHTDNLTKSGVQVPLYIHSRFLDVKSSWEQQYGTDIQYRGGVVTNTRFSEDAVSYGTCAGLFMISWDFPANNGLKYFVDKSGLYPLTTLISLTKAQKRLLLDKGTVLCCEITDNPDVLREIQVPENQIRKVMREVSNLIKR